MQTVSFVGGKPVFAKYMDSFPFPYYIVLRDTGGWAQRGLGAGHGTRSTAVRLASGRLCCALCHVCRSCRTDDAPLLYPIRSRVTTHTR